MENSSSVETSLIQMNYETSENNGRRHQRDSMFIQLFKRIFAVAPLIAMVFSTLNQIFAVTKSFTSQSDSDQHYNEFVEVISNGESSYFECKYGNAQAVVTYCPYQSITAFKAVLAVWIAYFSVFMIARLFASYHYSTDDLRFYIAIDRYNGHLSNQILVALGAILTLVTLCVSIYYLSPQTEWNSVVDTTSLLNIFLFVGINVVSLQRFLKMTTGSEHHKNNITMNDFPVEIPVTFEKKKFRVFMSVESVIKPILVSYMLFLVDRDASLLQEYGQPTQLIDAMNKLYKPSVV